MDYSRISNIEAWLILYQVPQLKSWQLQKLLAIWNTPEKILQACEQNPAQYKLTNEQIASIRAPDSQKIKKWQTWLQEPENHLITWDMSAYPTLLKQIPDPPKLLFAKGNIELLVKPQLAMVGSRLPSPNGVESAFYFAKELVGKGFVITSGMALGIDGASHRGTLNAKGKTIAVLGSGLSHIYPPQHKKLAEDIVTAGGLIISEFAPEVGPFRYHFPQRNRIISGLSLGVLVVEASLKSGSLITARLAAEYGREVFALPGNLSHHLAKGCLELIQQGAKLVTKIDDITFELGSLIDYCIENERTFSNSTSLPPLDQQQEKLLQCVDYSATSVDLIIIRSQLAAKQVISFLGLLELNGYIALVPGGYLRIN